MDDDPDALDGQFDHATLCYPRRGDELLLIRKKRGLGAGVYVGPGGKLEPGETLGECAAREVREEVGLRVNDVEDCGSFDFYLGDDPTMRIRVYRTASFDGTPTETPEADPRWFPVDDLPYGEMWTSDRYWLPAMLKGRRFRGSFRYDADGDRLRSWWLREGLP